MFDGLRASSFEICVDDADVTEVGNGPGLVDVGYGGHSAFVDRDVDWIVSNKCHLREEKEPDSIVLTHDRLHEDNRLYRGSFMATSIASRNHNLTRGGRTGSNISGTT